MPHDDAPERYRVGQTALLAAVPEAEPLVGHWRRRFDASASAGVPAHVTVLFPFLDTDRLDTDRLDTDRLDTDRLGTGVLGTGVLDDLRDLIGAHRPFTVRFSECRRFPDVLYLAPEPDQPFRALTESVARRWPEAPPYGGEFAEVVPHLTVAHGQPPHLYDEAEAALAGRLPLTATISSVGLFVSDGRRWRTDTTFPLLG